MIYFVYLFVHICRYWNRAFGWNPASHERRQRKSSRRCCELVLSSHMFYSHPPLPPLVKGYVWRFIKSEKKKKQWEKALVKLSLIMFGSCNWLGYYFVHSVCMSSSRTGFQKDTMSGSQNYFLQISVNNVKHCLYGWILISVSPAPYMSGFIT